MRREPATSDRIEQIRKQTMVKGEVICRVCGRPAGECRRIRLLDPADMWSRIKEALLQINDIADWRGERWGIRLSLRTPEIAGFDRDCLAGWKGEEANYCLQATDGTRIHVRHRDHSVYEYTIHREFDPKCHLGRHIGDAIYGKINRNREMSRLTRSAYDEPENILI
jgi:hypothetical protein